MDSQEKNYIIIHDVQNQWLTRLTYIHECHGISELGSWAWVKIDQNSRLGPGPPKPRASYFSYSPCHWSWGEIGVSGSPLSIYILIRNQSKSSQYLWRSMVTSAEESATWARVAFSATASLVGLAARLARCYQPHLPRNPSSRHPVHLLGTWRVSSQASPNLWYYQIFCMHSEMRFGES